ncbi:MAG: ComEC/Rec2 family competence protein, partial [Bacteroidota bacterium]
MSIKKIPTLKLLVPLIFGISLSNEMGNLDIPFQGLILLLLCISIFLHLFSKKSGFFDRALFYLLTLSAIAIIGFGLHQNSNRLPSIHWSHSYQEGDYLCLSVIEHTEFKSFYRLEAKVLALTNENGEIKNVCGKLVVNMPKSQELKVESIPGYLLVKAKIEEINSPLNPLEIDFKKVWAQKGVYHQCWLRKGEWRAFSNRVPKKKPIENAKNTIAKLLQEHFKDPDVYGIVNALVLGDKKLIQHDLKKAYTDSGVIYVLAVSGMHIGILYLLLRQLKPIFNNSLVHANSLYHLLLIAGIWSFTFLSGAAASTIRAALMFSIWQCGKIIGRQPFLGNTILCSAIILLLAYPNMLFDIGFQLSYSAVIGIVFLMPGIERLWTPQNQLLRYFWKLMALSLAAQLITAPLSLLYFHQFSNFFLPSGL